mmetsp:Transcript_7342/g.14419  ORF Transcript_7342/g.14419 Transcript_7342/m.14419 type:complete len:502 (+) Transcript_7342:1227-2732(+)
MSIWMSVPTVVLWMLFLSGSRIGTTATTTTTTSRFYHGTTTLKVHDENNNNDHHNPHDKVESTRHLPRLFIDASASFFSSTDDENSKNNSVVVMPLREKVLVPLTVDQEHYLLDVMRITNSKRWGQRNNNGSSKKYSDNDNCNNNNKDQDSEGNDSDSDNDGDRCFVDYTGCVRVFNGVDGEWLAKVVVAEDSGGGNKNKKQRRKRGGKQKSNSEQLSSSSGTVLECLEQLLPQERTISSSSLPLPLPLQAGTTQEEVAVAANNNSNDIASLQLYMGYLKDKQRRRWVVEKATELGADTIAILDTDFSNNNNNNNPDYSGYKKNKEFRWEEDCYKHRLHAIEAAEQCERLTVPDISSQAWSVQQIADRVLVTAAKINLDNDNDENTKDQHRNRQHKHVWLVCRERSESSPPILSALQEISASSTNANSIVASTNTNANANANAIIVHVLVGPEGGWSPRELEIFSELEDIQFVSLGASVLRAETAAITAVAAVQMHRETMI